MGADRITLDASYAIEDLGRTLANFTENLAITLDNASKEQPTLRDRFAMAALQGLASAHDDGTGQCQPFWQRSFAEQAAGAYALADAMLAARAQPVPEPTP